MGGSAPSTGGPLWATSLQIFLTTIAVLLGTGILGLPIKLVLTGFVPFLVLFGVTLGMQVAIVFVHADTLQRAQKHMQVRIAADKGAASLEDVTPPRVDLHTMGRLYLTPAGSYLFDAAVLLTFVATLISYSLAGANAFSQLLGVPVDSLILPFVLSCTAIIVFASGVVQPVVSVLTFVKVVLLTFIIGTCGVVAERVATPFHSSWADVMSPFLVGTVAIGGIADMMPVFFAFARPTARQVSAFRWSIVAGILACFALNVVWARAVLGIVPQTRADAAAEGSSVSLEAAGDAGDIATKPVIQVIDASYPQYRWVASTVTAFITLSITVSFNAVGLGIKHVLDGMAVSLLRGMRGALQLSAADVAALEEASGGGEAAGHANGGAEDDGRGSRAGYLSRAAAALNPLRAVAAVSAACASRAVRLLMTARGALYVGCFGSVLGVALADPSGFITVLEICVSMALNMAGGVMVVMMYVGVRRPPHGSLHARAVSAATPAHRRRAKLTDLGLAARGEPDRVALVADGYGDEDADDTAPDAGGAFAPAPIASPLNEVVGAVLAVFCLATYAMAVVYDMYHSGISQGAYGPPVAAWIAAAAVALMWRFAGEPTLRMVADVLRGRSSGPDAPVLPDALPDGLGGVLEPDLVDAAADVALAMSTAWAASATGTWVVAPCVVTGAVLVLHALRVPRRVLVGVGLSPVAAAAASDGVTAAAAAVLAGISGAAGGQVGPAALRAGIAAAAAGVAVARVMGGGRSEEK